MNRATQGLQISLIISVMLNVVLGVTTYLYNKQAFEKGNAVTAADARVAKAADEKKTAEDKYDRARTLIGNREADIDTLEKQYDEDQASAVAAPKPAAEGEQKNIMGYSQLIKALTTTRDARTTELNASRDKTTDQEIRFRSREEASKQAVTELDQGYKQVVRHVQELETDYRGDKDAATKSLTDAKGKMDAIQVKAAAGVAAEERRAAAALKAAAEKDKENRELIGKIASVERDTPEPPTGLVTWVSLQTKTVWIDRGRADSLPLGIRFTVYAAETNTSTKAVKKGIIEVTRVPADHQAECRIVEDKFDDPMLTGDKIFNAFWSPGDQKHFALSGVMNLDGDGRHQVNTAIGLIKSYGGVVDCWLDEQGHRQGRITAATRYLVQGDTPDKSTGDMAKNDTLIQSDAKHYQLHVWPITEFKQKMDYRKTNTVEHFGSGATAGEMDRAATAAKAKAAKPAPAATKATDEDADFGK